MAKFRNKDFVSPNILGRNYGECVLTHAVNTQKAFFSILEEGIIRKPSERDKAGNFQYMGKIFNIHDCIYFSAGWEYNSTFHHWPFSFIFKKTILKNDCFEFFKTFMLSQGWMKVLRYWRDNDLDYLKKIKNSSPKAKSEINLFLKKDACAFWLFEKDLEFFIYNYPQKNEIFVMLRDFRNKYRLSNNYSIRYLCQHYFCEGSKRRMEIVSHESIPLKSNYFVGLYIEKKHLHRILPRIKKYFTKDIIIFDGEEKKSLFQ